MRNKKLSVILVALLILSVIGIVGASTSNVLPADENYASASNVTSRPAVTDVSILPATITPSPSPARKPSLTITSDTQTIYINQKITVAFTVNVDSRCNPQPGIACPAAAPSETSIGLPNANVNLQGAASGSGTTNNEGKVVMAINPSRTGSITATASKDGYNDASTSITVISPPDTSTPTLLPPKENPTITVTGYIRYTDIEGGFEYIEGDNGKNYDIYNYRGTLPPIGTRVTVEGIIRNDVASTHVFGQMLEITKLTITVPYIPPTTVPPTTVPPTTIPPTTIPPTTPQSLCIDNTINMEKHNTLEGDKESFGLDFTTTKKTWDIIWYIDDKREKNENSVTGITTYENTSSSAGKWIVSAVAINGCNKTKYTFDWTVNTKPQLKLPQITTPLPIQTSSAKIPMPTSTYIANPTPFITSQELQNQNSNTWQDIEQLGRMIGHGIGSFIKGIFKGLFQS